MANLTCNLRRVTVLFDFAEEIEGHIRRESRKAHPNWDYIEFKRVEVDAFNTEAEKICNSIADDIACAGQLLAYATVDLRSAPTCGQVARIDQTTRR